MTATVKYPSNEVTPHGWYYLTQGNQPTMRLRAYDGSIDFYLMGGYSDPDRFASPEWVHIPPGGLTGLIPPWKHIDQKGATQDGVTNIDALYDPIEVGLKAVCRGRDGKHTQRVVRDLIASLDAKQESELSWITQDLGYWWAPVRWFQGAPPSPLMGAQQRRQELALRLRADSGFWRSYDDTTTFAFAYESIIDEFNVAHSGDLGVNWPLYFYDGAGAGHPYANGTQAAWSESGLTERGVVFGPYKDFATATDNQVIEFELGSIPETVYANGAFNDGWGRMSRNLDGTWKGDGIRARVGMDGSHGWVELARFNNFVKTVLFSTRPGARPQRKEKFSLVCGIEGDPRMFRIMRNGIAVISHKEVGTGSLLGSAYRGVGGGMKAGAGASSQASPAWVNRISAGDNATVTQSGFLARTNIGDQKMYDDYTVFGPCTVRIWDGPGAGPNNYVEFGPLLANQVAFLRTDPRDRNVYDLAAVPANPSQQERSIFDAALNGLLSFASAANVIPLLSTIQSLFGVFGTASSPVPPQGNFYALLKGRFSDASAIPAKSPGNPAQPYHTKVQILNGTADSKVIASGVPLRRWPL